MNDEVSYYEVVVCKDLWPYAKKGDFVIMAPIPQSHLSQFVSKDSLVLTLDEDGYPDWIGSLRDCLWSDEVYKVVMIRKR